MFEQMPSADDRPAPRRWTKEEEQELVRYIEINTPNRVIASKMGRTSDSVRKKAAAIGLTRVRNGESPTDAEAESGI